MTKNPILVEFKARRPIVYRILCWWVWLTTPWLWSLVAKRRVLAMHNSWLRLQIKWTQKQTEKILRRIQEVRQ